MFKFIGELPRDTYVAVSGGADSMAVLDFLTRDGNRNVEVLHFNHGTTFGDEAQDVVDAYCGMNRIKLHTGRLTKDRSKEKSPEEWWRLERYNFLGEFSDKPVITCHHLGDQVESWIFTALHGDPKLIPYKRSNYIRPFLITRPEVFRDWCSKHWVPFLDDPANKDTRYMRSLIRHNIVHEALKVNPGLWTTIRKKTVEQALSHE